MIKNTVIVAKAELGNKDVMASDELIAAVNEGNGRASKFAYSAAEVVALALCTERRLERSGLPQAERVGFEARFDHEGPSAKAYKFTAAGRSVTMRRATKGWVLVSINEINVYPAQIERVTYCATEKQIAEMQRRAVLDLSPIRAAA